MKSINDFISIYCSLRHGTRSRTKSSKNDFIIEKIFPDCTMVVDSSFSAPLDARHGICHHRLLQLWLSSPGSGLCCHNPAGRVRNYVKKTHSMYC